MRFHVMFTVVVVALCGKAAAQCYTSSFCFGATNAAASFADCCMPVVINNNLERSFSMPGAFHCQSCIVLGLNQSQYTLAERSGFYYLRLRLLSPANTLLLGRPRLRLLGVPGTASMDDFRLAPSDILISSSAGYDVAVTISLDDIAGEPNETFIITAQLPLVSGSYDADFLFRDSVITIIDFITGPPIIQNGTRYNSSVIQIGYGPHCLTTREATITCQLVSGTDPITFSWSLPNGTIIAGGNHLVVSLPGSYSCNAANDFGNDSASSEVIVAPCVDFFGMISKQTGNGCSRLRGPLFEMNPDMCAYVGDRIQFTCTLAGKGEVTAPLISSPEGTVIITGLVIEAFVNIEKHTASGGYDCSFSTVFANGSVSRTINVEVFDPPTINTTISLPISGTNLVSGAGRQNLSVIPGTILQLYCPATGKPTPSSLWFSGGSFISASYTTINGGDVDSSVLVFEQNDNFTEYSCTASNVAGSDTRTVSVRTLIINRANYSGSPTELDEDNTIIIGDSTCIPINGSVRINCSTYQNNLVYQWSKDGEVITNPSPPDILTVTQRGNYTCTATNSASTENATSWIEVTPPSISFQIMSSVKDCSRLDPIPVNVTWCPQLYNRVDFHCTIDIPGQTPLITFSGTPFTASYIESFTTSNNGMYRCSFQNNCGTSAEVEINLQAFQPAKVDITTDLPLSTWSVVGGAGRSDIRVNIGGNVTLYCPTTGIDTPNTRWLLNGTTIVSNLPRVVLTNETVNDIPAVVLTISNITTSDLVTYTCVTSNSDGTDTQNITIRDIDSVMSTSRTTCASPCLAISAANSKVIIVSPLIPALGVPITAIVISSAIGGILVFISILVAVTIFIVLRAKWQKKKMIDLLEQDFQRRKQLPSEYQYRMSCGNFNDGVVDKRTSVPQIRPEVLPLIGSAIILGRDIKLQDKIGQGEFGVVYKANFIGYNNAYGRRSMSVAVKTMQACCTEDNLKTFLEESLKMKELCHPNVMNLLGVCLDAGPTPYIVLPFMENGDLLSYIKKHRESLLVTECDDIDKISEVRIKLFSMCLQISKGMEYLASQNIIHRDLAARNCMIDGCGMVKVADFGLSKSAYEKLYFRQEKSDNAKLPIKWLAVECIEDGIFSEKSDVWAFGVTCWEVFSGGKMPYGGLSPLSLLKLLKCGERMEAPDNAACSQEIYQTVMYQCWHGNPDERPTFSQLQTKISGALSSMADYLEFSEIVPCDEIDKPASCCEVTSCVDAEQEEKISQL